MKHGRIWAAGLAVAVLGGGGLGFVLWREAAARDETMRQLMASTDSALRGGEREEIRNALRQVRDAAGEADDPGLTLAAGRLLLALERDREAWETVELVVTRPGSSPEAKLVGAQILARIHAMTGELVVGDQARGLAEQHARATGAADSWFLAWQLAFRTGDALAFGGLREVLLEQHSSDLTGLAVDALDGPLVALLATRVGLPLDRATLEEVAAGRGPLAPLGELALAAGGDDGPGAVASLRDLEQRWDEVPGELELVLANAAIADVGTIDGEPTAEQRDGLVEAIRRLERVLESWSTSIDARHAVVVALFGRGELDGATCQGHVRWLLSHGGNDDVRRQTWEALRRD